jgi:hypothetical protein
LLGYKYRISYLLNYIYWIYKFIYIDIQYILLYMLNSGTVHRNALVSVRSIPTSKLERNWQVCIYPYGVHWYTRLAWLNKNQLPARRKMVSLPPSHWWCSTAPFVSLWLLTGTPRYIIGNSLNLQWNTSGTLYLSSPTLLYFHSSHNWSSYPTAS